ncbi:glycerate kinase [Virgibacillus sp. W0181]|uniref:glycerate kinase n=1 Tax=Virgibacillus sp. W0181 TaxID=3391581 RepID=UPI003F446A26
MKIVVAPDAFKGSLTQVEAAIAMERAVKEVQPSCSVIPKPMADGGEGTLDAMLTAVPSQERLPIHVTGPLGNRIKTTIGVIHHDTAVIEVATIAGLPLITEDRRDPLQMTTYGIGEAIRHALDKGLRKFIIGLGGSATNDGGFGMLLALGAKMSNRQGNLVPILGSGLLQIDTIDLSKLDQRLKACNIQVASDVENPLYGKNGASVVFGPQKGATEKQIKQLDDALKSYSSKLLDAHALSPSLADEPGAGAAGGLGFAFMAMGGTLLSGAKLVADAISLEREIADADLVITGEGKSDEQTLYGKAPGYVGELANKHNVPVILLSGTISDEDNRLKSYFTEIHSIKPKEMTLTRAMEAAEMLLWKKTKEVILYYENS